MEIIQELVSTLFIALGVVFIMIAAVGILRLPDFYIRMSAITKAGTMGVGLIVVGIAVFFNELLISAKAFVIISFMLLTAPVAAHIIARAAYKQGVPFWGRNLVDELADIIKKRDKCEETIAANPDNIDARLDIMNYHMSIPPVMGGSLRKAVLVASEIKEIDRAEGHRALGMVYERDKDFTHAEQEYLSAIEASKGESRYRYELGLFYVEAGWYEQAFGIFDDIYANDSNQVRALFETGRTAALSGTNMEKGEAALNKYLNTRPVPPDESLSDASYYMGIIFIKRKDYSMAGKMLEKALLFNPRSDKARYHLDRIGKK
ncbi:MAG: monovalent cation/H(+) antiporter subunit G [Bacteroidales bacterium]